MSLEHLLPSLADVLGFPIGLLRPDEELMKMRSASYTSHSSAPGSSEWSKTQCMSWDLVFFFFFSCLAAPMAYGSSRDSGTGIKSDLWHSCGNMGSLIHCTTEGTPWNVVFKFHLAYRSYFKIAIWLKYVLFLLLILVFCFLFFVFLPLFFLELLLRHMEVPRLGVELEL